MNRQEKSMVVEKLRASFESSQAAFIVEYKRLTVDKLQQLRKSLRRSGGRIQVAKGRLMKRAVQDVPTIAPLGEHFRGQIGIVFATDVTAVAKALYDFAKENEALLLKYGTLESRLLTGADVQKLAKLPSKEVLVAQLCGTLRMPMLNTVRVLNVLILRLLYVLKQISEMKEKVQA